MAKHVAAVGLPLNGIASFAKLVRGEMAGSILGATLWAAMTGRRVGTDEAGIVLPERTRLT